MDNPQNGSFVYRSIISRFALDQFTVCKKILFIFTSPSNSKRGVLPCYLSFKRKIVKMFVSLPCSVPKCFETFLEFFEKNDINFCISGGYAAFRAGFCNSYSDVDIFIDDYNFNEKIFLELDRGIQVIPNENYVNVAQLLKKRFGITVMDSDTTTYKIDFVLMNCGAKKIENSYLFSEHVTAGFDIDVCRVSIISVDEDYRLIFNSMFKVFLRNETQHYKNHYDEDKISVTTWRRQLKYENRLKPCYRIFYTNCAPPFNFDSVMKFRQLNMEGW